MALAAAGPFENLRPFVFGNHAGTAASVHLRASQNAAPSERSSRLRDGQTLRSAGLDRRIFCSSGRVNGSEPPECDPRQPDRAVAPALAQKTGAAKAFVLDH